MHDNCCPDIRAEKAHLEWETLEKERVWTGSIFSVNEIKRRDSEGKTETFCEVDSNDWVTVIPWYRNEEEVPCFLMVQQFRHGTAQITCEFPAGSVDDGEVPFHAAERELLEETGCAPISLQKIGEVSPNAAFMTNRAHFYLANGVVKKQEQQLDPTENLDVISLPVETVIKEMGTGIYDNGIMMIALAYFLRVAKEYPELIR